MHVAHLSLHDFRSYGSLELALEPGVSSLVGRNGQGKTNVVEAVDYLSRLSSHRVAGDQPLVRQGAERAVVRAAVVREDRTATLEVEINPGRSNRARVNRAALPRARDLVGLVRTVVFAPDDLALVKGDPSERRRFADDLQVLATPRYAGTKADYDRVVKQRSSLLRTARLRGGPGSPAAESMLATLEVWDDRLAALGAEVMLARAAMVGDLLPLLGTAYAAVARGARREDAVVAYRPSFEVDLTPASTHAEVEQALLAEVARRRRDEVERGVTLVGPHRDELVCTLGDLPVKGYASHGEGWSFALALRLASYELLRQPALVEGGRTDDPILVLDDVFAELDTTRRAQLAELVAGAEQVLVTAAVPEDVPAALRGRRYDVADGEVVAHG